MNPVEFKGQSIILGKDHREYLPLPAHRSDTFDGVVTSCWGLSFFERIKVLFSGRVYVQQITWLELLQPQKLSVYNPLNEE